MDRLSKRISEIQTTWQKRLESRHRQRSIQNNLIGSDLSNDVEVVFPSAYLTTVSEYSKYHPHTQMCTYLKSRDANITHPPLPRAYLTTVNDSVSILIILLTYPKSTLYSTYRENDCKSEEENKYTYIIITYLLNQEARK